MSKSLTPGRHSIFYIKLKPCLFFKSFKGFSNHAATPCCLTTLKFYLSYMYFAKHLQTSTRWGAVELSIFVKRQCKSMRRCQCLPPTRINLFKYFGYPYLNFITILWHSVLTISCHFSGLLLEQGFHLEFLRTDFHRCSSLQGILHTQETIDTRRKYFITRHELTFL